MNVAAVVLTHNQFAADRAELFDRTLVSLREADRVFVVDNSSTDGTAEKVAALGGYCSTDGNTTCGHGTNLCARVVIGSDADLYVLSDDDMEWSIGWCDRLVDWWEHAPDDVWLTGCHLEPMFPWNTITGTMTCGDQLGLLRKSTGAASWSFRDWSKIGPIPEKLQGWGDVPACTRLVERGGQIAQLDLATHIGAGASSWGNRTEELHGWDLAPVRRVLECA